MDQHILTTGQSKTVLRQREGVGTPVLYVPGHTETFSSRKPQYLMQLCERLNLPLTIPAYYGWEGSTHADVPEGGRGYIRHWLSQYLDIIDQLTTPHVLVGNSMGGILMLQLSRRRPDKIAGLIGIAAGFGINGQKRAAEIYGNAEFMGLKGHMPLTYESRGTEMVFAAGSFPISCPTRLQYGMRDDVVSWKNGNNIAAACDNADVQVWVSNSDDHSMSQPDSLNWLENKLRDLTASAP